MSVASRQIWKISWPPSTNRYIEAKPWQLRALLQHLYLFSAVLTEDFLFYWDSRPSHANHTPLQCKSIQPPPVPGHQVRLHLSSTPAGPTILVQGVWNISEKSNRVETRYTWLVLLRRSAVHTLLLQLNVYEVCLWTCAGRSRLKYCAFSLLLVLHGNYCIHHDHWKTSWKTPDSFQPHFKGWFIPIVFTTCTWRPSYRLLLSCQHMVSEQTPAVLMAFVLRTH